MDTYTTECWSIWPNAIEKNVSIEKIIDETFGEFPLCLEAEWKKYDVQPPEGYDVLGAWRDRDALFFIFLLSQLKKRKTKYFILYSGVKEEEDKISNKIKTLKSEISRDEKKVISSNKAEAFVDKEYKTNHIQKLINLIGLFTIVINALSIYLRKIQTPEFPHVIFESIYKVLVIVIHFSALFLLLIIIFIYILYSLRYGFLLLRRMRV